MSEQKIKPYIRNAKYYETDQMGIIHHSNYIRWMEEARIDYMSQFGIYYGRLEEKGIIIPVLSVSCQYRSMVRFNDDVSIKVKLTKFTGIKLELAYEFTNAKTGEVCTTGTSAHCFLDRNNRFVSLKRECPDVYEIFKEMLAY